MSDAESKVKDLAYQYILSKGAPKKHLDLLLSGKSSKRENLKDLSDLFYALLSHAKNRNMMNNVIGDIDKLSKPLFGFNHQKVLTAYKTPDSLLAELIRTKILSKNTRKKNNSIWPRYCMTILSSAKFVSNFKTIGEFNRFVNSFSRNKGFAKYALPMFIENEIYGFGFALACDFLKENGHLDFVKPDVHIRDIFINLGFSEEGASDFQVFKDVILFAEKTGHSPYYIDKLFWLIGSGNLYGISHHPDQKFETDKKHFIRNAKKLLK